MLQIFSQAYNNQSLMKKMIELKNRTCAICLITALFLTGCVSAPQSRNLLDEPPESFSAEVRLAHVPFFPQEKYQCGPAALAMMLVNADVKITPEELVSQVYVPGKQGSYQLELVTAARRNSRLAWEIDPGLETLLEEIDSGRPVLVLQNLGIKVLPKWHFAVVTGYDLDSGDIILNSGTREHYTVSMKVFERTWARSDYWGLVIPAPGELPVTATPDRLFASLADMEHSNASDEVLEQYYQQALTQWSEHTELMLAYGNLLYRQGDLAAAESLFNDVIRVDDTFAPGFNNLAWLLYEQGRLRDAQLVADRAVALGGRFVENARQTQSLINQKLLEARSEP